MALFLLSLAVLFLAGLVAFTVVGSRSEEWPPPGTPPLPGLLWVSTALIAAGSLTVHRASRSLEEGRDVETRRALAATIALGLAFLLSQIAAASQLVANDLTMRGSLAGWMFYFLTGLHATHVIAGLGPLGLAARRAYRGKPPGRDLVRYGAAYWHFLGVVWVVLFAVLARTLGGGALPGA